MKQILLVEDSPHMGRMITKTLEQELQMPVTACASLEQTRQVLMARDPEDFFAAVLDFVLPDAPDGQIIDLVVGKNIPSIVFTAGISEAVRKQVWSKKVVDYILKEDPRCLDALTLVLKRMQTNALDKLLIVDDSLFFRKVISELLYIHQYKIILADNGTDALRALNTHPDIKLVITDYHMKGMNGIDLCREIRKHHPRENLAIIGMSTEGDPAMAARFIKSGANDFIIKQSFIMEEFYCRISQCIDTVNLIQQIREAAIRDFLTGLYNRRYFFDRGRELFENAKNSPRTLACAMMDIDHFKKINDTHGHDAGDKVLAGLASLLKAACSPEEIPARLGGEEFCILAMVPHGTPDPEAEVASRFNALRQAIQDTAMDLGPAGRISVTVSMGLSFNDAPDLDAMLKQADQRLYLAKKGGRNRLILSQA